MAGRRPRRDDPSDYPGRRRTLRSDLSALLKGTPQHAGRSSAHRVTPIRLFELRRRIVAVLVIRVLPRLYHGAAELCMAIGVDKVDAALVARQAVQPAFLAPGPVEILSAVDL